MKSVRRKAYQTTAKRIGLRVPKNLGEKALRVLSHGKLVDQNFQVVAIKASLFIPMVRRPDAAEIKELMEEFGTATVVEHVFQQKISRPRNLREALVGKLPRSLLTNLPSSYDIIGDIAVLDLPFSLSDYEKVLADGIQKVNNNVRVVLAKAGAISGVDRILPTRHLVGENRTETIHRESGCSFKVDVARAYFSPRLAHEHERVAKQVEQGEVVTDLFAGVGPFSIMIAKRLKDVEVNAIDSNPDAVSLAQQNVTLNKVEERVRVWPGDARGVVEKRLSGKASRVIMNHPSAAKEFIDVACKALKKEGGIIHYYTFTEGLNCEDRAITEFEDGLKVYGWRIQWLAEVRRVRGVSPMKWQVAVDAPVAPIR